MSKANDTRRESLLKKYYIEYKLSTYKIAAILQCDPKTIYRYLKKYNIKTRPVNKPLISKITLLDLYKNKHLSLKQIGNRYDMTASGILKRMRKFNIPMRDSWETNTGVKLPYEQPTTLRSGFHLNTNFVCPASFCP